MPDLTQLSASLRDQLKRHLKLLASKFDTRSIPVGLAILTILSGLIGWSLQLNDLSFESVASVIFKTLGNFSPAAKNLADGNLLTKISALCGLLAVYSSALLIAANLLRESRRKFVARFFYRNHGIIIGDTSLAQRVNRIWSRQSERFLQIISSDTSNAPNWANKIVRHKFDESLIRSLSLHRAKHVFIDLGDDIQTYSLAFQLLSALPRFQTEPSQFEKEWIIVGRDINLADHFSIKLAALHAAQDGKWEKPIVHYLDPEQLIARHFMAAHPLFLLAARQSQRRVHMMIVDFGLVGRHFLESTFLTALTVGFDLPCITIVTRTAEVQKKRFFATRPALADRLDIAFFEADTLLDLQAAETQAAQRLRLRDEAAPVTLIVLTSEKIDENIGNAFLIDNVSKKLGRFNCPVFALNQQADETAFLLSRGKFSEAIGGFSLFGLPDDLLELQLSESKKRDALAKALHAQYEATSSIKIPKWNDLPESLRRANRNAADHWRAKMYAFGYDISKIETGILPKLSETDAKSLLDLAGSGDIKSINEKFLSVVQLEHERWMLERSLDGWVLGKERDDIRQIHPSLLPWDILFQDFSSEVLKDVEQIKGLIDQMTRAGDPQVVLKKL